MFYTTTVSSKGQIVIPEEIRKLLLIKPGFKINVSVNKGKIIMEIDNYELRLEQARIKNRQHIKDDNIEPISDEDIKKS